jgi:hypothetical protein
MGSVGDQVATLARPKPLRKNAAIVGSMTQRLFLPGAAPGMPMWQPRAAQQTAWQQAFELVADAVGEPSIRPEAMTGDPEDAFAEWLRGLGPEQRQEVALNLAALSRAVAERAPEGTRSATSVRPSR